MTYCCKDRSQERGPGYKKNRYVPRAAVTVTRETVTSLPRITDEVTKRNCGKNLGEHVEQAQVVDFGEGQPDEVRIHEGSCRRRIHGRMLR